MRELFDRIFKLDFPEDQYYREKFNKEQIYLHHTASGRGIDGDFRHWLNAPSRIATCVIVGWDGRIYQLFSSKYWGHHLGIKKSVFDKYDLVNGNLALNRHSIGIEIDSWGPLTEKNGKYYSWAGSVVPKEDVIFYTYGYRGHSYYQKYTEEQIRSVELLLKFWNERYEIPLDYNDDVWKVTRRALCGNPGVFTHNSVRPDKTDVHPQLELIEMWKSL